MSINRLKLTRRTRSFWKRQWNLLKFSPAPQQWEAGQLSREPLGLSGMGMRFTDLEEFRTVFELFEGTHYRSRSERIQNWFIALLSSLFAPLVASVGEAYWRQWETVRFTPLVVVALAASLFYWVKRVIEHNQEYYCFSHDQLAIGRTNTPSIQTYAIGQIREIRLDLHQTWVLTIKTKAGEKATIALTQSMKGRNQLCPPKTTQT